MIYEPAEDSELLLEAALKEIKPEDEVIEIGAGSGFVAERLKDMCKYILTTDISPYAARELRCRGLDVVMTDIAGGIKKKFSLVLFNPPYVELEDELKKGDWLDVAIDGGKRGLEVIRKFLDSLEEIMDDGGRAILIASSQNEPEIFDLIKSKKFVYEITGKKGVFFEMLYAIKIWRE
uniref:Protein methyltransferase n=1 Tax=Archaeoglobus fulgidus TaxID=2234 RepID=A0A7C2S3Z1_ARCFL